MSTNNALTRGIKFYTQGRYEDALKAFEQVRTTVFNDVAKPAYVLPDFKRTDETQTDGCLPEKPRSTGGLTEECQWPH